MAGAGIRTGAKEEGENVRERKKKKGQMCNKRQPTVPITRRPVLC